jgi:hypothetical protein
MDEWIGKQGAAATDAVRDEHLANLNPLRDALKGSLSTSPYFKMVLKEASGKTAISHDGPSVCYVPEPGGEHWRNMFWSFVSTDLTLLQTMMRQREYRERFADLATAGIAALGALDISCIPENSAPARVKAEVLASYAHNVVMYSRARRSIAVRWLRSGLPRRSVRLEGMALSHVDN